MIKENGILTISFIRNCFFLKKVRKEVASLREVDERRYDVEWALDLDEIDCIIREGIINFKSTYVCRWACLCRSIYFNNCQVSYLGKALEAGGIFGH